MQKVAFDSDRNPDFAMTKQNRVAMNYYDETNAFYSTIWNDDIHFGLFEKEDYPQEDAPFSGREKLTAPLVRMTEAIVAPGNIIAEHHVVDVGCGFGGTVIHLAKTRGCRVSGVNLNHNQLKIAEQRAATEGVRELVDFHHGNADHHLPFKDNSIDVVTNIESACHYSNRKNFLSEVYRILKPGGRIVASDWLVANRTSDVNYNRYIRPLCESWALSDIESRSTYKELLFNAGLTVLECTNFEGKDFGNVILLESYCRSLRGLKLLGSLPLRFEQAILGCETICLAWRLGYFELGRYCAVKPF